MKKIFLIICVLGLLVPSSQARIFTNYTGSNFGYQAPGNLLVSSNLAGLTSIERRILNRSFEYDTFKNRVERLEQKIFGAIQQGNLDERYNVLKSASKNYAMFNPNPQNYYSDNYPPRNIYRPPMMTGTMGSSWKSNLLGNFRNQFIGTPTGFTPAMDPAYMDYFEAERQMMGSGKTVDYADRNRRYHSNINRGSGVGVTILD